MSENVVLSLPLNLSLKPEGNDEAPNPGCKPMPATHCTILGCRNLACSSHSVCCYNLGLLNSQ